MVGLGAVWRKSLGFLTYIGKTHRISLEAAERHRGSKGVRDWDGRAENDWGGERRRDVCAGEVKCEKKVEGSRKAALI